MKHLFGETDVMQEMAQGISQLKAWRRCDSYVDASRVRCELLSKSTSCRLCRVANGGQGRAWIKRATLSYHIRVPVAAPYRPQL